MSFVYRKSAMPYLPNMIDGLPIFFTDEGCKAVIEAVIDEVGNIQNFPGIIEEERWIKEQKILIGERVVFEAKFYSLKNECYLMVWLIQPSGTYWMDKDGFGIEDDLSIQLYSVVNQYGRFEKPFEIYSVGRKKYCHEFDKYTSR